MRKFYILDTNVLIHDPTSILRFEDNCVILPIEVIREIDHFKRDFTDRGQNARHVSRLLDGFRRQNNLAEGVELPNGGLLRVACDPQHGLVGPQNGYDADTNILRVALETKQSNPQAPVVLVTKDINLRIRADVMGLRAEDYESDRVNFSAISGQTPELELPVTQIQRFMGEGFVPVPPGARLPPNQYLLLKPDDGSRRTALARVSTSGDKLVALIDLKTGVYGIRPRNMEQYFALDALLNDKIKMVTVMGKAGTGKTLLSIAAALQKVVNQGKYKGVLISRPTLPVGKDLGFLPGTIGEKLVPWTQPINDALEFLAEIGQRDEGGSVRDRYQALWDRGVIRVEPLTYIRGRSIANHFIVVDEAQNLTPLEVKTIITRIGDRSKIVLAGDPYQIDNPYIDTSSSGFTRLAEKFRGHAVAAHCELLKGERSELAELAANLL